MQDWKKREKEYGAEIAPLYDRAYYHSFLEDYYLKHFGRFVRKYAQANDSVLDIGCGTGHLAKLLLDKGYSCITGTDLSFEMASRFKERVRRNKPCVADAEHLPFRTSSFDVIILSSTLHHFPQLSEVLPEIKRVLTEYGVIILREPNQAHHFTKPSWLSGAVMNLMHYLYRIERHQPIAEPQVNEHHRAFDAEGFLEELARHFHVIHFSTHFPFSSMYTKLRTRLLIRFVLLMEKCLSGFSGTHLYVVAANHESTFSASMTSLRKHIDLLKAERKEPKIFIFLMYALIWLARMAEKRKK